MALPHRFGMISAWVTGLLLDVLYADPLGVNGFCLAALTYVTWSFYERFRMYSVVHQWLDRGGAWGWWILLPALVSTLLWPVASWLLGELRHRLGVE